MTEEEIPKKMYLLKLNAVVHYVDGSFDVIENIDVIRQEERSIIFLKDRMVEIDFFRTSIQFPLANIRRIDTTITDVKETE